MFSVRTTFGAITIIVADIIIGYLIYWIAFSHVSDIPEWLSSGGLYKQLALLVIAVIIVFSSALSRLYSFIEYIYPVDLLRRIIPSFFIAFTSIATLGYFTKGFSSINWRFLPPLMIIYVCLFVFRWYLFFVMPKNRTRILILGANEQTRKIVKESLRKRFRGYEIVGIATSLESQVNADIHGIQVLHLGEQLEETVREYSVDSIVVTQRDRRGKLPVHELLQCKVQNIHIQEGFTFYEKVERKIIVSEFLKPSWFVFEEGFFQISIHKSIKRMQGIIVSFFLLTILSPILILVAIAIKLESPGSVFFQQERVGRRNKVFKLLKFRSMRQDAETINGPTFAQKNDPRITRVGLLIRKIRIDEVPQFINIFKGDMDMVGPRPERPVFVDQLKELVPYYGLRHTVRPGLTGWAQVNYPYGDNFEDSREKLHYDLYYVKHFSWYLDLLIIFMTVREVLFGRGR
ncbi:MAG: glycosyl transferase [Candidatus Scalindua sp.]|nr:TIGR03013 family PEP-CTERM/XrtA system glycosyltransferase [Planctomycetota bacterium]GJQ59706.1 MAG: glycosyl transferase [Candidatus Scalindua sp.]